MHELADQAAAALRRVDAMGATGPAVIPLLRSEAAASSKVEQIAVK